MNDEKLNVLLFGLGAIGSFYAFILGRNKNVSLSVVARSNYDSVKANGLLIQSAFHGEHQVRLEQIYRTPSEAGQKFDFIVCTNKAIDPERYLPLFKDVVDDRTTFAIIQNGVGNEDSFREHYPKCTLISCVTWVGAVQLEPHIVEHIPSEDTKIGLFPNPDIDPTTEKSRLDQFASLLRNGGTKFSVEENVQVQRWEKVVWNTAWNSITTLTGIDTQVWLKSSPQATETSKRLLQEVADVGKRCGVPLPDNLVDTLMERILGLPGVYSSMYVDVRENRPTEVEAILGTSVRKAEEFGMDVPLLTSLYAILSAIDQRIRRSQS